MGNSFLKIFFVILFLFASSQILTAQFYKQRNSAASMLKNGVGKEKKGVDIKLEEKKKIVGKKKNKKPKKSRKKTPSKSDTVKKRTPKYVVEYVAAKHKLGDRIIMRGDSGADVRALAAILVERLFLDERDIVYTADGGVLYDGTIIKAVRSFQKVSGIYEDGMVGTATVKALRKRDK